jgi:hypothetical protein
MTAVESTAPPRPLPSPRPPLPEGGDGATAPTGTRLAARLLRWVLLTALAVAFVVTCRRVGLPTDRVVLLGWVLAGLGVCAVTDGLRRVGLLLVDWLPLAAVLLAYDASRGLADGLGVAVHVTEPVAADRWMAFGALPTAVLQQHWDADWWAALATLVYASHFVVTPLLLAVLWMRNRRRWVGYARLVVALSAAGLLTYVLYPAAPPWLAAKDGVIEPVARLSGTGWEVLGLPRAGALLADSQAQVNQVAAVPSLHTAFAVLACLALYPLARRAWQRAGLVAYPVLMAVVLVWSGEHYVIDTLLGAAYAGGVVALAAPGRHLMATVAGTLSARRRPSAAPTVAG